MRRSIIEDLSSGRCSAALLTTGCSNAEVTSKANLQAWRKPGLQIVAEAFLGGGLHAAYEAFAALPHTEAGYEQRFAYNADVTRICDKDDHDCIGRRAGQLADENLLWVWP